MTKLSKGFLLIDKPAGMTSHDVVDAVRKKTGKKRVGHAGTLDPFATGLLIVGVGRENTKQLDQFKALDKTYEAIAVLGVTSTTGDVTGKITPLLSKEGPGEVSKKELGIMNEESEDLSDTPPSPPLERGGILDVLKKFTGEQEQIPPMYSAKKVGGKKLYELAREGQTIERKPHPITVHSIKLLGYNDSELKLRIKCGAGTYVRTLIEDIGEALGVGAYTKELRRTKIGEYRVDDAQKISN